MYDNVKFALFNNINIRNIERYATDIVEQINRQTGQVSLFGIVEGLRLKMYPGVMYLQGSLTRLVYPNNIHTLNRHTTQEAIEKISDCLHLDFKEANVVGLEYGTQYTMKHNVCKYLDLFLDLPGFISFRCSSDSLYYQNKDKRERKTFVFYDKIADARAKGMIIPPGFEDMNLLKYEMRLQGKLLQQLKVDVKASTLYDEIFYRKLMQMYQTYYFKINKMKQKRSRDLDRIKTVSDALCVLMGYLINQADKDVVNGFINELKESNVFADKKYYTRLNKKLEEILEKGGFTVSDENIKELDEDIKNIGAYV